MIKVLLVEDHHRIRLALARLLQSDSGIVIVGETNNGEEAIKLTHKLHPDVIIIRNIDELIEAVYEVYEGRNRSQMSSAGLDETGQLNRAKPEVKSVLTDREMQIVKLIVLGFSNRCIADKLRISVKTVGNHKTNIMKKLNLRYKHELIQYAIRNHMMELSAD